MAWWDAEELKPKRNRSDRYKVAFPDEYDAAEVADAQDRLNQQKANKELKEKEFDLYKINK